jgi:dihydrofolate reductase
MLSLIAIIGKNRELGKNNKLLFNIPDDLKHFRTVTANHPVIMGRKTWESVGRPLPNRTNIVISSQGSYHAEGARVVPSLAEAITIAKQSPGSEEIFVIGGGTIYKEAIGMADRLYLTLVDAAAPADTFFPDYSRFTKIIDQQAQEAEGFHFTYLTLEASN